MSRTLFPTASPYAMDSKPTEALLKRVVIFGSAYFGLFLYYYSFMDYGLNLWDEGGFAYGTLRTLNGQMAVRDFNPIGYLPGRYIYASWFFDAFGVSLTSLRLSVVAFTPFMVLMVFFLARRLMPLGFSLLAAIMTASAPGMYYNRFFPFFTLLTLICLVRLLEKKTPGRVMCLILAILLCVPFKMEISIFASAMTGIMLLLQTWTADSKTQSASDRGSSVGAKLLMAVGAVLVAFYFYQFDIAQKFINLALKSHAVWGNPFPPLFPFLTLWVEQGPSVIFERLLFYAVPLSYAILLVFVGLGAMQGNKTGQTPAQTEKQLILITIAGFGLCAFGLVIWRAGFDNLVRTLGPFTIVFALGLFRFRQWLGKWITGWGQRKTPWYSPEKAVVLFLVGLLPGWFLYEINVAHGYYVGSIGAVRHNTQALRMERAQVFAHPAEAEWVLQVVKRIKTASREGDSILALPLNPVFYFLTDRTNPIVYDWILPGMLDTEAQKKVVHQLKIHMPRLVIFADLPIDGREDRRFSNYAPAIYQYLKSNYQWWENVGVFQLLIPRKIPLPEND